MKMHLLILAMAATFTSQQTLSAEMDVNPVGKHYASLVHANYEDTLSAAKAMQKAINAFLANPLAQSRQAAQQAWLNAREF